MAVAGTRASARESRRRGREEWTQAGISQSQPIFLHSACSRRWRQKKRQYLDSGRHKRDRALLPGLLGDQIERRSQSINQARRSAAAGCTLSCGARPLLSSSRPSQRFPLLPHQSNHDHPFTNRSLPLAARPSPAPRFGKQTAIALPHP